MATKTKTDVKLILVVDKDDQGNTTNVTFSKIDLNAPTSGLLTAAKALGSLQTRTQQGYKVNEIYDLAD